MSNKLNREEQVLDSVKNHYHKLEVDKIMRMYHWGMLKFFNKDGKVRDLPLLRVWHPLGFLLFILAIIFSIPFDLKNIPLIFKYVTFKW